MSPKGGRRSMHRKGDFIFRGKMTHLGRSHWPSKWRVKQGSNGDLRQCTKLILREDAPVMGGDHTTWAQVRTSLPGTRPDVEETSRGLTARYRSPRGGSPTGQTVISGTARMLVNHSAQAKLNLLLLIVNSS